MATGSKGVLSVGVRSPLFPRFRSLNRISAGPLDRRTTAQAMRGGGGEQASGSSLRKHKAIYDICNVCQCLHNLNVEEK